MTQPDKSDSDRRAVRITEAIWHLEAAIERLCAIGYYEGEIENLRDAVAHLKDNVR